ncbi:hypothetical protein [Herbiconiux daphne]|uniref:Uncharacterized protein n=1 Tax=Herbiconiux daphne TaxID=2970914 RepID=A0ABT2H6N4_9MICO|nr:hypothetical protein [Herbiconiux daphne]MCS5735579.1 hypothetical protein [Herbiconiux daphne]
MSGNDVQLPGPGELHTQDLSHDYIAEGDGLPGGAAVGRHLY